MPRADEHEGDLNDSEVRREGDRMKKRSNEIISNDLAALTESATFLRWFGKYAHPVMTQDIPVNNGSTLAHFIGRRQLVLEVIKEMDMESPGFLRRVLEVRDLYERELLAYAQQEEK